jgi:hypothetical protein
MLKLNNYIISLKNNISSNYKYYIYAILIILSLITIIYISHHTFEEKKYDIALPNNYIYFKNNYNNNNNDIDIFFTMEKYSDNIPSKLDLRSKCPPIYDQGKLGLCHINAACFVYRYICLNNNIDFNPSRMFCEYNILHLRDNIDNKISIKNQIYQPGEQGAATIEDINTLLLYGTCEENDYPYPSKEDIYYNTNLINEIDDLKKNMNSKKDLLNISNKYKELKVKIPDKQNYINAQNHKISKVYKLNNDINEIKKYLNHYGPIIFGFNRATVVQNIAGFKILKLLYNLILNKETGLNNSDKEIINNNINIINKHINNNNDNPNFHSYYNLQDKLTKSNPGKINNLLKKYINDHINEIFTEVFKNASKKELTLKYPTELIIESEKYCKENDIDLDNAKNNMEYFNDLNINNSEYINNNNIQLKDKLEIIKGSDKGDDVYDFIKTFSSYGNLVGHALTIVGYDDEQQLFIIANSWSENWGDKGYFYMDYKFFEDKDLLWGHHIFGLYGIIETSDGSVNL